MPFSPSMGMVDRIHRFPENFGPATKPPHTSGLPDAHEIVLGIAERTDTRHALPANATHFCARKLEESILPIESKERRRRPRGPDHLAAAPDLQLDVMHLIPDGNVLELHPIADFHFRLGGADDGIAAAESLRRKEIAPLSIAVLHQEQTRRTIGIVLYGDDVPGNAIASLLPEIDEAIEALVASTTATNGYLPRAVATRDSLLSMDEGLFRFLLRQLRKICAGHLPSPRTRWFIGAQRHGGQSVCVRSFGRKRDRGHGSPP